VDKNILDIKKEILLLISPVNNFKLYRGLRESNECTLPAMTVICSEKIHIYEHSLILGIHHLGNIHKPMILLKRKLSNMVLDSQSDLLECLTHKQEMKSFDDSSNSESKLHRNKSESIETSPRSFFSRRDNKSSSESYYSSQNSSSETETSSCRNSPEVARRRSLSPRKLLPQEQDSSPKRGFENVPELKLTTVGSMPIPITLKEENKDVPMLSTSL
jgi:hypothetical protein